MIKYALAFVLLSTVAFAQQQPDFNLKLNANEIDTIGKGLGKLAYEEVASLIQKLRQQIVDQQKAAEKAAEPAK